MKSYDVAIHENLQMIVTVQADSALEAEEIVKDRWKNGDYILDADHFTGVEFKAELTPNRDRGR